MRAKTPWLSETEKSRDRRRGDRAARPRRHALRRLRGPAAARRARRPGGRGHRHRPPAARARRVGGRPVPAERPDGRPHRGRRRPAGRGRALPLRAQRLRRQDARLPHRRAPRQHAAGPARVHGAHGRAAAARHHVDAGQRVRRAARAARARRVLHDAHRDVQARDLRRLPRRGRRRAPHLRGALRRPRAVPRAAAHLDRGHRGLAAAGRRRRARHPHRPGQARRAHRGLLDDHRRRDLAGHAGRHRRPGRRRVPRHRHGPAGRGAGRPRGLLLRLRRARHAAHDLRARLPRERR